MDQLRLETMTDKDIYNRVCTWYKETGLNRLKKQEDLNAEYQQRSQKLIKSLPEPDQATPSDMYFIFQMISSDLLEWAFQETDENGISMGAYARHSLHRKEEEIGFDELFNFLRKSKLFKEFSRIF
ncbi:MAG: hypothetical protein GX808_00930 [Syntrophomonadaceae bacterium]|jgi:hypothetical protein|nr:hypothetical protein [Syntrophomonadaceae bacterium]